MDLEHLNKSQIVLLTLLVSFVTSIATGIVSVTLMEQAPPAITQTVNRIVERTVEKMVPEQGQVAAVTNVVTEKVVTVREEDRITSAVAKIDPSVVRLYTPGRDEAGKNIELFVGIAIVTNKDGALIADEGTPESALTAVRSDGVSVKVTPLPKEVGAKVVHLQAPTSTPKTATSTEMVPLTWTPATFSTVLPKLGESIVVIAGRISTRVASGIVTALSDEGATLHTIETSVASDLYAAGSPIVNTDGEVIGIATRATREAGMGFLASSEFLLDNGDSEGESASEEKPPSD